MPAELTVPLVTTDQLDLVKRTIAADATPDELRLYLFDCARQGVHPLDKLLHFTKRSGKYTPVTSIDFMRIRAAETGEYAGNDDAVFFPQPTGAVVETHPPAAASVTVYRIVQGQRYPFTATARWSEYKPDQDFMWRRMPHTMLAKCAEALALRKGFPRQLAGLYAAEELDQAREGPKPLYDTVQESLGPPAFDDDGPPLESYDTVQAVPPARVVESDFGGKPQRPVLPEGAVTILRIDSHPTKSDPKLTRYRITLSNGNVVTTIKANLAALARMACERATPVRVKTTPTKWGDNLDAIRSLDDTDLPF